MKVDTGTREDGVLDFIGLDAAAVRVYRTMLHRPGMDRTEIGAATGLGRDELDAVLERLLERGVVRPSQLDPAGLRTESPDVALRRLLADREVEIHREREQLSATWVAVSRLIEEYRQARPEFDTEDIERLTTPDTTVARLTELMEATTTSIDSVVAKLPAVHVLEMAKADDVLVLERGIRVRELYPAAVRHDAATMDYARWFVGHGGHIRGAVHLPTRIVLHDSEAAVVALDPTDISRGAVVVHTPGIVAALQMLFDELWKGAQELVTVEERGGGPTPDEIALLQVLARGAKDEAAARTVGVSVRTVRRMISSLSERLDANGRLALGAEAARRGWL